MSNQWRKRELYGVTATLITMTLALVILAGVLWTKGYTEGVLSRFRVAVACAVFMSIFSTVYLRKAYSDMRKGEPAVDERSRKIKMYAAGYTFFTTPLWFLVMLLIKDYLTNEQVIGISLVGLWVIFGMWWWYLNRKGDVDA